METLTIKITTNKESTYKPMEKQDLTKKNSFSDALEKFTSKDKPVNEKADNTSNKGHEIKPTETKPADTKPIDIKSTDIKVDETKFSEEISNLDPSLQSIMAMLQAFISGKIDLETLLKGASKDIKGIIEQKISVNLNTLPKTNITDGIKQLSLELMEGMKNLKQNENISKDLPSIIMDQLKNYIETLESDSKNNLGNLQTTGTLEDKIKAEISNIVLKTLKESGVNLTSTNDGIKIADVADGIKVANLINETKVIINKGNTKEIQNTENIVSSLNGNIDDSKVAKFTNAEGSAMSSEKNSLLDQKNSMSNEEKILKSIMTLDSEKGDKDSSITKATNFISQFEAVRNDKITPDTLVINKNNFSADIVKSVKFMQTNNLRDLTVTIAPKELGEVIIKITMYGGTMKASITATSKEAYNILNSNLTDITNKLNNLDMKIQDFTLNIYNGDTTFFKQGTKGENSKEPSGKNSKDSMKEVGELSMDSEVDIKNTNNVNMLA